MLSSAKEREFDYRNDGDDEDEEEEEGEEEYEMTGNQKQQQQQQQQNEKNNQHQVEEDEDEDDEEGEEEEGNPLLQHQGPKMSDFERPPVWDGMRTSADVIESDMGDGLPFRPGVFDGAISISAIQWLLVASSSDQRPEKRIKKFFNALQSCLAPGARAALQFYPENTDQINKLTMGATQCGFSGGVVVDYPHSSKARKYYLVIYSGHPGANYQPPRPLGTGEDFLDEEEYDTYQQMQKDYNNNNGGGGGQNQQGGGRDKIRVFPRRGGKAGGAGGEEGEASANRVRRSMKKRRVDGSAGVRPTAGSKEWVLMKKAERRKRGDKTSQDSKYTMRRRKPKF